MKWATLYALTLLVLIYFHTNYAFDVLVLYVVGTVLMYTIAVGAAEFQLLMYCRFNFPSFNISWEQHKRETPRYQKKNKKVNRNVRRKENEYSRFTCSLFNKMWKEHEKERK